MSASETTLPITTVLWLALKLLIACSLAVPLAAALSARAEAPSEFADTTASLSARLDALRRDANVPAMGLALFDRGKPVLVQTWGTAQPDTPFRWGSITKSFTGLAALQLTRLAEVELDTPIHQLIGPDYYENDWAPEQPVRFGDLLALSAGFVDLNRQEWADNEPRPLDQALSRFASERRTLWPPGLQHSYFNVPPGLTAAVIERTQDDSFEAFLRAQVFEPLGMQHASLAPVPRLPGGFRADGKTEIDYWHMTFAGFGALNASMNEMSRFIEMLQNDGRLDGRQALPADLVETFFRPANTLAARACIEIGYGAGVYGWVRHGHVFQGHGGDADGHLTFQRGSRSITLHPAGSGRFYRDGDPLISVVVADDTAGTRYLQGEIGNYVRISPGPCPDFLKFCE